LLPYFFRITNAYILCSRIANPTERGSGHFSKGRKWSEIGRKIFEKMLIILMKDIWNT